MGKSRSLSWEFEKYLDGLLDNVYWHRGRCLAYGEGVAYRALADMVRMRARITEESRRRPRYPSSRRRSPSRSRIPKSERSSNLGCSTSSTDGAHRAGQGGPLSAWRLFVERMAEQNPVVMVFEDIHWADAALLEFVEALLERSRSAPDLRADARTA